MDLVDPSFCSPDNPRIVIFTHNEEPSCVIKQRFLPYVHSAELNVVSKTLHRVLQSKSNDEDSSIEDSNMDLDKQNSNDEKSSDTQTGNNEDKDQTSIGKFVNIKELDYIYEEFRKGYPHLFALCVDKLTLMEDIILSLPAELHDVVLVTSFPKSFKLLVKDLKTVLYKIFQSATCLASMLIFDPDSVHMLPRTGTPIMNISIDSVLQFARNSAIAQSRNIQPLQLKKYTPLCQNSTAKVLYALYNMEVRQAWDDCIEQHLQFAKELLNSPVFGNDLNLRVSLRSLCKALAISAFIQNNINKTIQIACDYSDIGFQSYTKLLYEIILDIVIRSGALTDIPPNYLPESNIDWIVKSSLPYNLPKTITTSTSEEYISSLERIISLERGDTQFEESILGIVAKANTQSVPVELLPLMDFSLSIKSDTKNLIQENINILLESQPLPLNRTHICPTLFRIKTDDSKICLTFSALGFACNLVKIEPSNQSYKYLARICVICPPSCISAIVVLGTLGTLHNAKPIFYLVILIQTLITVLGHINSQALKQLTHLVLFNFNSTLDESTVSYLAYWISSGITQEAFQSLLRPIWLIRSTATDIFDKVCSEQIQTSRKCCQFDYKITEKTNSSPSLLINSFMKETLDTQLLNNIIDLESNKETNLSTREISELGPFSVGCSTVTGAAIPNSKTFEEFIAIYSPKEIYKLSPEIDFDFQRINEDIIEQSKPTLDLSENALTNESLFESTITPITEYSFNNDEVQRIKNSHEDILNSLEENKNINFNKDDIYGMAFNKNHQDLYNNVCNSTETDNQEISKKSPIYSFVILNQSIYDINYDFIKQIENHNDNVIYNNILASKLSETEIPIGIIFQLVTEVLTLAYRWRNVSTPTQIYISYQDHITIPFTNNTIKAFPTRPAFILSQIHHKNSIPKWCKTELSKKPLVELNNDNVVKYIINIKDTPIYISTSKNVIPWCPTQLINLYIGTIDKSIDSVIINGQNISFENLNDKSLDMENTHICGGEKLCHTDTLITDNASEQLNNSDTIYKDVEINPFVENLFDSEKEENVNEFDSDIITPIYIPNESHTNKILWSRKSILLRCSIERFITIKLKIGKETFSRRIYSPPGKKID